MKPEVNHAIVSNRVDVHCSCVSEWKVNKHIFSPLHVSGDPDPLVQRAALPKKML